MRGGVGLDRLRGGRGEAGPRRWVGFRGGQRGGRVRYWGSLVVQLAEGLAVGHRRSLVGQLEGPVVGGRPNLVGILEEEPVGLGKDSKVDLVLEEVDERLRSRSRGRKSTDFPEFVVELEMVVALQGIQILLVEVGLEGRLGLVLDHQLVYPHGLLVGEHCSRGSVRTVVDIDYLPLREQVLVPVVEEYLQEEDGDS